MDRLVSASHWKVKVQEVGNSEPEWRAADLESVSDTFSVTHSQRLTMRSVGQVSIIEWECQDQL